MDNNMNDLYVAGEPDIIPICDVCNKTIKGVPIENIRMIGMGTDAEEVIETTIVRLYCCKEHEYLDMIVMPEHRLMGDIKKIINHLIKMHKCEIPILENVLNSEIFKKVWKHNPLSFSDSPFIPEEVKRKHVENTLNIK